MEVPTWGECAFMIGLVVVFVGIWYIMSGPVPPEDQE